MPISQEMLQRWAGNAGGISPKQPSLSSIATRANPKGISSAIEGVVDSRSIPLIHKLAKYVGKL